MQAAAQGAEGVRVLVLLAAIAVAVFWRTVLRLVLVLVVAAIVVGAIAIFHATG